MRSPARWNAVVTLVGTFACYLSPPGVVLAQEGAGQTPPALVRPGSLEELRE